MYVIALRGLVLLICFDLLFAAGCGYRIHCSVVLVINI